jgi:hypothetical protein
MLVYFSRDNSFSTPTGHTGWTADESGADSLKEQEVSILSTASRAHPAFYPTGTNDFIPGVKRETDLSPFHDKVKHGWNRNSTPTYSSIDLCSLIKHVYDFAVSI